MVAMFNRANAPNSSVVSVVFIHSAAPTVESTHLNASFGEDVVFIHIEPTEYPSSLSSLMVGSTAASRLLCGVSL